MTKVVCDYVLKINSKDNTFPKCFGKVDSDCYGLVWSETSFQQEEDELTWRMAGFWKVRSRALQAAFPFVKVFSHPQSVVLSLIRIMEDKKLNISAVYRWEKWGLQPTTSCRQHNVQQPRLLLLFHQRTGPVGHTAFRKEKRGQIPED